MFAGDESLISETGWQKFLGGGDVESKKYLPAVSTSIALAAGIGIAEAIALAFCSGLLMNFMGYLLMKTNIMIYTGFTYACAS